MKYCRFLRNDKTHYGAVEERNGELWIAGPAPAPEEDLAFRVAVGKADAESFDFEPMPMSAANLLAPVRPSKIICVGRNYRDHAKELGNDVPVEPLIFFKPPSSLLKPGGAVRLPGASSRVDFEGELALVIGRRVHKLKPDADLRGVIRGYTLADDVSARDLQKRDVQWTRAKGFDTFCPFGPTVVSGLEPWSGVRVQTRVNGEIRQDGTTADFIFPLDVILRFISQVMTLEPGDLIATGTPAGVSPLQAGDVVEVTVEGVGSLRNPVGNA